jgi:hypothetical protein
MFTFKSLSRVLAAAAVVSSLGLTVAEAGAAPRGQAEFINQPGNPNVCRTDEGYGRFSTCDQGH